MIKAVITTNQMMCPGFSFVDSTERDEIRGSWRKLQNRKLHNLYSSQNFIRMIKLIMMRWAEHVGCKGEACMQGFGRLN